MVRSAVKFVSKTRSKPARRSAVFISKVSGFPGGRPKHSPIPARGLGAVWMTTCFFGSSIASQISSMWSCSRNAPVGQRLMHWPQLMQTTSASGLSMKVLTCVSCPRSSTSSAPTSCRSTQVRTHRRQRTHLFMSRTTEKEESSISNLGSSWWPKRKNSTPYSFARLCSSQLLLRAQE